MTSAIRKQLAVDPSSKWGFVIYRLTYGDDSAWARLLEILTLRARESLELEDEEAKEAGTAQDAHALMASLEWTVQEDPATLDGASKSQVRTRFKQYVESSQKPWGPRYAACLAVDAASLASVLEGPQPPEVDLEDSTFVYLIDRCWEHVDRESYDWEAMGQDPAQDDPEDEGEEEVEGCKMFDVGWMKVNSNGIAPRTYDLLDGMGWDGLYVRPPRVVWP